MEVKVELVLDLVNVVDLVAVEREGGEGGCWEAQEGREGEKLLGDQVAAEEEQDYHSEYQ